MENKKKMAFNVVFLILVFAGTIYGVFHGEDLGEIARILKTVDCGCSYLCSDIYMGRIHHYLLYDENSWNQKKKVDLLFVFVCWIFL